MEKNEVIYISSDDDDNKETKQNKTNDKQASVTMENNVTSDIKTEDVTAATVEGETCGQKRKISEIDSNDDINPTKSAKVFVDEQKSNDEACNGENSVESADKQENNPERKMKPQLIVKERITFSPMVQDIFPMFISLCLQKDRSEDMKVIVNKLKRRYEQLDAAYTNSDAFITFLNEKRNDIMNSKNLYTHIAEVMNEMKSRYDGRSSLLNGRKSASNTKKSDNGDVNESAIHADNSAADVDETNKYNREGQKRNVDLQEKIDKILYAMDRCRRYIKKFEEAEIDFDEENNSNYIKLERFKYRMVELYNKYCELTGENADAGRQYLRPKHFSTTGIVAVDHAITNFINSKISKRRKLTKVGAFVKTIVFPDYRDILECIEACNKSRNLGLDNKKITQIAKKAFCELGEYLQRSRRNDYWDTFSLFLDNEEEDPALKDPELANKLIENKTEGEKRLANVFETYVQKQEEMKDQPVEDDETSSTGNEEDEEESEDSTDDISEINLSLEEDENSADEGDSSSSKSKAGTHVKPGAEIEPEVVDVDVEKKCEMNVNDTLKNSDDNNSELTSANGAKSIPDCENNFTLELTEEKDVTPLPDTLPDAILSTEVVENPTVDTDPLDVGKEDVPNGVSEESTDSKQLEEEKPLLRVRSFAKPPTTWQDTPKKVDRSSVIKSTTETLNSRGIVDLTTDTSSESEVTRRMTIQIGSKVVPIVKGKYNTVVIPTGNSIINVKNITNNYVRLNTRNLNASNLVKSQNKLIIVPMQPAVSVSKGSSIVRLPSNTSLNQQTNANNQARNTQLKQFSTKNVQIPQTVRTTLDTKNQKNNTLQPPKSK